MEEILGTRETRETPTRELPWQVWGRLGHEVLAEVYARLGSQGWPQAGGDLPEVKGLVRSVLHQKSLAYTLRHGNGYWLLWENMMRRLGDVIGEVIAGDREDCVAQAWNPVAFEVEANGVWPGLASGPERRLPIYGRLDRVDMHQNGTALRVVDYKFSWSRAKKTNDPDLIVEAGQGKRLQPPLYALMTEFPSPRLNVRPKEEDSPVQEVVLRFIRPFQDPSTGRASFSQSNWGEEYGRELARRVDLWLKGIQLGKFFLVSGAHCQGCSWAGSCRSQHYPSWSRVQRLPLARAFRLLKKQPIDHD